ncbi:MAG: YaiI/YqxD family protein [bacterium]|nr:YaiI/YqxD family protein [bacterium]
MLPDIFIDADACPVKQEVYRVAKRYGLKVILVSNTWTRIPDADWLEQIVVPDHPDAADDWIVDHITEDDIVISPDIPLSARCLEKDAHVLSPRGRFFTKDSIGEALANRDLRSQLRDLGIMTGGPSTFGKKDRSRFLQRLDQKIQAIQQTG